MSKYLLAVVFSLVVAAIPAMAETIECSEPRWTAEPVVDDGRFKGELTSECQLSLTQGQGLSSLRADIIRGVESSSVVHSGPSDAVWEEMPAVRYDVTRVTQSGDNEDDKLSVRSLVDVAANPSRVAYVSRSSEIKGKGNAGLLRRLDVTLDTRADTSDPRSFRVRLVNLLEIKKPWYAPDDIFLEKAAEATLEQYLESRDLTLKQVWSSL